MLVLLLYLVYLWHMFIESENDVFEKIFNSKTLFLGLRKWIDIL